MTGFLDMGLVNLMLMFPKCLCACPALRLTFYVFTDRFFVTGIMRWIDDPKMMRLRCYDAACRLRFPTSLTLQARYDMATS